MRSAVIGPLGWEAHPTASRKARLHEKVAASLGPMARAVEGPSTRECECCSAKGRRIPGRQNQLSRPIQHLAPLCISALHESRVHKPGFLSITLIHSMYVWLCPFAWRDRLLKPHQFTTGYWNDIPFMIPSTWTCLFTLNFDSNLSWPLL